MADSDTLIRWLNDAYAMERAKENMLDRFARDFYDFPEIQNDLNDFQDEARQHSEDVRTCIESLGASISQPKSMLGGLTGLIEGISTSMYKDEVVKNMLMVHTGMHLAHASYLALAKGAAACGEPEIADMCRHLAEEEKAAAEWAETRIPEAVDMVLDAAKQEA